VTALDDAPATASAAPSGEFTRRQILTVFAGLMAGMFVAALDQTIVSTAMPTIIGELRAAEHYSWVAAAYLLTSTAAMPLVGKLSDLYGRKLLYQVCIAAFTAASLLCALAQDMTQLIVFRALQGVGGGGLIVLVFAIVGDVVPPRDRGRYQGLVGSVFAVASVIGPLVGGAIVDHASWRWVFLVNLPVGVAAIAVVGRALDLPFRRREQRIDYAGAALLVPAVTALILVCVWGGTEYPWRSGVIVGLAACGVALLGAFVWWERRVAEPLLPLRLFSNRVVSTTSVAALLLGMAMFGAIFFLPVYLQIVQGRSATNSGLLMLPVMAGILVASTVSGRMISRIGRYKAFPLVGMAVASVAFFAFSTMTDDTAYWVSVVYMATAGVGMGMANPTLVLAVQNAVHHDDLGAATSAVTFTRSMGGAFGTAIFGSILTARLSALAGRYVPGADSGARFRRLLGAPDEIRGFDPGLRRGVVELFEHSLHSVFRWAVPVALAAFLLAWFIPELPLRRTSAFVSAGD
jgi:EmrB/QacA subfamily drug resistance transporter